MMEVDDFDIDSKGKEKITDVDMIDAENRATNLPWYFKDLFLWFQLTNFNRVEKYRPTALEDVISQNDIISTGNWLHIQH